MSIASLVVIGLIVLSSVVASVATIVAHVLTARRQNKLQFSHLGVERHVLGSSGHCTYTGTIDGRTLIAEYQPGQGLQLRVPCRTMHSLSIGAKVALAGLTGTMPPDRQDVRLRDPDFAGLSLWADDRNWAEKLLDRRARHAVLALLRPGNEVRSIIITPVEIRLRALSIAEHEVTPERMVQWIENIRVLVGRAEVSIPSTLVVPPTQVLSETATSPGSDHWSSDTSIERTLVVA